MLNLSSCSKNRKLLQTLFIALILSFIFYVSAQAADPGSAAYEGKVIDTIETVGNINIKNHEIYSTIRSKVGRLFSDAQAQEDVKRIATINGVELAYYSIEPVGDKIKLIFVIKEKTLIRDVTFSAKRKYGKDKLLEKLEFKKGDYLDKLTAQNGAERLLKFYHTTGYPYVKIDYDISGIEKGILHYTIDEGPRVKISKVVFEENDSIKDKELKKVIKSKPRQYFFMQNYYQEKVIQDDLVQLQKAYDKRGYLDTKVSHRVDFSKNRKKANLVYVIEEGKRYAIKKIDFVGNEFYSDANLADTFRLKEGDFYSNEEADECKDEILERYRRAGFVDVEVKTHRQFTADDQVIARFDINEGLRYQIGQVNISGNSATQDKVIRRVLDETGFTPGQWYNAHNAKGDGEGDLEKGLKATIYAETVTITPIMPIEEEKQDTQKDAEVRITEGKTGMIMFGAGISSADGLIGQAVYEQRNFDFKKWPKSWRKIFSEDAFKGAGQTFRVAAEPGTEVSSYSISFTEPYFRDKPVSMTTSASSWQRYRTSFDEERLSGHLGFTKRLKEGKYRSISFRLQNVGVENLASDAPKEVVDVKGDNLLAGVSIGFGRNTTDKLINPTKGKRYGLSYEQVAGDHTFGVIDGSCKWYKVVKEDLARKKTVLETRVHAGAIIGDAPLFEKYYAGGLGSIRGFSYYGISPRSGPDDDPVGSDWIADASAELNIPLTEKSLAGLLFVDGCIIDTGGLRSSIGVGIQIMIPQLFGEVPMRFELAYPWMKHGDDDTEMFSFSVGGMF
ncbi:MAG: BamA/TamA family outer membrane protein [Sedimentisphaerales bacterium]|nr:BamA/TamA family outer membrane protein [Sedimentisphaerales bacterium]